MHGESWYFGARLSWLELGLEFQMLASSFMDCVSLTPLLWASVFSSVRWG